MDIIIYHNADPDGNFGGAVCLKKFPNALTIGYNYEPHVDYIIRQCLGKNVVMVDLSFKNWEDMHRLLDACASLTWIDHHKAAFADSKKFDTEALYPNFICVFEHDQYGACRKAFQHFFPKQRIPLCIDLVACYDTWREYGSEYWDELVAPFRVLSGHLSTPQEVLDVFQLDYDADDNPTQIYMRRGTVIGNYLDAENELLVNNEKMCYDGTFTDVLGAYEEYNVLLINRALHGDMFKTRNVSNYDFLVGFYRQSDGWKVSLRGCGKRIDLGALAKKYGGGGHKDAAGFSVDTFLQLSHLLF